MRPCQLNTHDSPRLCSQGGAVTSHCAVHDEAADNGRADARSDARHLSVSGSYDPRPWMQ